ncbi:MAG TPA: RNA polymerase subunit sigma-24 [Chloroflexi bacterium]|nr:RNA polymerase subunit sigma-24 [Chloroflexota bacterium]
MAYRVGSQQDAEDLTAQVFTEALDRLDGYRGQGTFAAWLFAIARHKVVDHYRQRGDVVSLESGSAQGLEAPDAAPEYWAVRNEQRCLLASALQTLAPEKQELLAPRFFAGLKYGQVAQALGKSEAAVKMMVYRALDELRARMLAAEEGRDAAER